MQNFKQQFLEICFIMNIKVVMAQAHIFIHFCAVVLLFFVNSNCLLQIVKKGGAIRKKVGTLLVSS